MERDISYQMNFLDYNNAYWTFVYQEIAISTNCLQ